MGEPHMLCGFPVQRSSAVTISLRTQRGTPRRIAVRQRTRQSRARRSADIQAVVLVLGIDDLALLVDRVASLPKAGQLPILGADHVAVTHRPPNSHSGFAQRRTPLVRGDAVSTDRVCRRPQASAVTKARHAAIAAACVPERLATRMRRGRHGGPSGARREDKQRPLGTSAQGGRESCCRTRMARSRAPTLCAGCGNR
jgi:hypothetical protein